MIAPYMDEDLDLNRRISLPLLNRLTNLAEDYDGFAAIYTESAAQSHGGHDRELAWEMRHSAAQLRCVRGLLYAGAMTPRKANDWVRAATWNTTEIRRALERD